MAINGIGGVAPHPFRPPAATPVRDMEQGGPGRTEAQTVTARAVATDASAAEDTALAVAPPPGTDAELWAVLTTEERAYFARVQSIGPLTYGRGAHAPALPRGGRIDVQA